MASSLIVSYVKAYFPITQRCYLPALCPTLSGILLMIKNKALPAGFSEEQLNAFSSLPGVSSTDTRYMTAGIIDDLLRVARYGTYMAKYDYTDDILHALSHDQGYCVIIVTHELEVASILHLIFLQYYLVCILLILRHLYIFFFRFTFFNCE